MKKLIIVLFPFLLLANEKEIVEFSGLHFNDTLSVYAGKVNMDYFDDKDAYTLGLMLENTSDKDISVGLGYTTPAPEFEMMTNPQIDALKTSKDNGILFFLNYNF